MNMSANDVINEHAIMILLADVAGIDQRDMATQISLESDLREDLEIDLDNKAEIIRAKVRSVYPEFQVSPDIIRTCSTVEELIGLVRDEVELG